MKFWIIVFITLGSAITYGLQHDDVLGKRIAKSITILRSTNWVETPVVLAEPNTTLSHVIQYVTPTPDEIALDMQMAKMGLANYIRDIPEKGMCAKARELLTIRRQAALRDNLISTDLAKRWSRYVRENFCPVLLKPDDYFKA
jgi:hypothetical protein